MFIDWMEDPTPFAPELKEKSKRYVGVLETELVDRHDHRKGQNKYISELRSGAPRGRQADSHIDMGNKKKPMNWFSHGYHG